MISGFTFIEAGPFRQQTKATKMSHEKNTRKKLIHSTDAPALSIYQMKMPMVPHRIPASMTCPFPLTFMTIPPFLYIIIVSCYT